MPGVVSPIGELSPLSLTYTKEIGIYTDNNFPGYNVTVFKSYNDAIGPIVASQIVITQIIRIIKAIEAYQESHLAPYERSTVIASLLATFPNLIENIELGTFVSNGVRQLPEWISWTNKTAPATLVKIWCADAAFATQYDEYEIVPVTPLLRLDDFFLQYSLVSEQLSERTFAESIDLAQIAKETIPETTFRVVNYQYKPEGHAAITTNWLLLIYGLKGDNPDAIREFLVSYILEHSTHSLAEWEAIFPDIFKRNEFILLPRWDKYAIPDLQLERGLYSSCIDPKEVVIFAKRVIDFYDDSFIDANITVIPFDYRALTLCIVNGFNNIPAKSRFEVLFSDYVPINSLSLDFNRMCQKTRAWLLLMEELIINAEALTPSGNLPLKFRRIVRNNRTYISCVYDTISYLMLTKYELEHIVNG